MTTPKTKAAGPGASGTAQPRRYSYVLERVACGKDSCGTCHGTQPKHGPYWYAYFTRANGMTGKRYVGKNLDAWRAQHDPGHGAAPPKTATAPKAPSARPGPKPAPTPKTKAPPLPPDVAAMLTSMPTPKAAARLLGVAPGVTRAQLKRAWADRIKLAHPDRGGCAITAAALNAAYALLKPLAT